MEVMFPLCCRSRPPRSEILLSQRPEGKKNRQDDRKMSQLRVVVPSCVSFHIQLGIFVERCSIDTDRRGGCARKASL